MSISVGRVSQQDLEIMTKARYCISWGRCRRIASYLGPRPCHQYLTTSWSLRGEWSFIRPLNGKKKPAAVYDPAATGSPSVELDKGRTVQT